MSDYHPGKEGTVRLEPLVVPASKGGLDDQWDHPRMWGLPGGTPTGLTQFLFYNYLAILDSYIFINSVYLWLLYNYKSKTNFPNKQYHNNRKKQNGGGKGTVTGGTSPFASATWGGNKC